MVGSWEKKDELLMFTYHMTAQTIPFALSKSLP